MPFRYNQELFWNASGLGHLNIARGQRSLSYKTCSFFQKQRNVVAFGPAIDVPARHEASKALSGRDTVAVSS